MKNRIVNNFNILICNKEQQLGVTFSGLQCRAVHENKWGKEVLIHAIPRIYHIPHSHCITNLLFPPGLCVDILGYNGVCLLVTTDDNEEAVLFILGVGVGCSYQVVLNLA